jgi:hypothetical protein
MDIAPESCDRRCDSALPLGATHAVGQADQIVATL